jgi:copper(I)-binding protein
MKLLRRTVAFLMILMLVVACRQQTLSAENINIDIRVTDSLVGETTVIITVTDDEGNAIDNPGALNLRGDMNHAGMMPVIRESKESKDGVFTVPFEWTMGGGWAIEATLTLENGEVVTETFDFEILTEASEDNMGSMNHSGETSAVYMSITNNGEETIIIVSIETDVAQLAELHETVVENDVAQMQPIEALVIDASETVDLMPGRKHIMLMQLTQDIVADEDIHISLVLDSGDTVMVMALVQDMLMDDLDRTTEVGNLVFSNVWARPASAGDMDD